jgi:hypothetical protein
MRFIPERHTQRTRAWRPVAGDGRDAATVRREGGQPALDRGASRVASARYARGPLLSARPGDYRYDRPIRRKGAGQPRLLSQQALRCWLASRRSGGISVILRGQIGDKANRRLSLFGSKIFTFHHVWNVCESPGQKPGFRLGKETAPARGLRRWGRHFNRRYSWREPFGGNYQVFP